MSESTPERYKPREEWTVDEILAHARTVRSPSPPSTGRAAPRR